MAYPWGSARVLPGHVPFYPPSAYAHFSPMHLRLVDPLELELGCIRRGAGGGLVGVPAGNDDGCATAHLTRRACDGFISSPIGCGTLTRSFRSGDVLETVRLWDLASAGAEGPTPTTAPGAWGRARSGAQAYSRDACATRHWRPYWTLIGRIGEAVNPGPGPADGTWRPWSRLRSVLWHGARTVSYPRPGRDGFRDFSAPGYAGGRRDAALENFELRLESANTTCWAGLKRRLRDTDAHVLLAQETWVSQSRMAEASAWARKRGWKSVWAPAGVGAGGGTAAGVAVFARDFLGLRFPDKGSHIWSDARAVAAVLEAPGFRPFLLASVYLVSGGGTGADNLRILADVGRCYREQGEEWLAVFGGDLNMTPQDITDVGFDRQVEASVFFPPTARGTYRTAAAASMLDCSWSPTAWPPRSTASRRWRPRA